MGWDVGVSLTSAGLGLDIAGLLVISFPGIFESGRTLEEQSGTYYNGNRHLRKALFKNRTLLRIGIPMMVLGFALQLVGAHA